MATITRGYDFGINELVTPTKLHLLVDKADVTNIALEDTFGVESASPASAVTGKMIAIQEALHFEASTYSGLSNHFNYLIHDSNLGGWVAFLKPLGMETRRFHGGTDLTNYPAGGVAIPEISSAVGVTLTLGNQSGGIVNNGLPQVLLGTIGTETIVQDESGRVDLIGAASFNAQSAPNPGPWEFFWGHAAANINQWQGSSYTSVDGVFATRNFAWIGAAQSGRQTGWLIGGPVFR